MVCQSYKDAAKWYRLAAQQSNKDAQFLLGSMYVEGQGVLRDDKEAIKWLRLAAKQGHAEAQKMLDLMRKLR